MSRTVKEWLQARDEWRREHNQKISTFPWPSKDSIVYNWSSPQAFWEIRRENAADLIKPSSVLFDENKQELKVLGERVVAIGEAERAKERALLHQMLPDFNFNNINETELITKLNEVMHGKKQYEDALKRIKAALNNEEKGQLAPSVSSLFASYLGTELSRIFSNFIRRVNITDPFTEWTAYFEDNLNGAIDRAATKMFTDIGKGGKANEIYGDVEQWRALGEAYKNINNFASQFQQVIRSKISFQNVGNMFQDEKAQEIYNKAKSGNRRAGFRKYIDNALHLDSRAGQIGGSVAEFVNDLMEKVAPKSGTVSEFGSTVIMPEVTLADRVTVYSFNAEVDVDAQMIANEISNSLSGSGSLRESARRLEEFYEQNLKKLDDSFIVYASDKEYQLNINFKGFHNGGELPLNRLPDYISSAGIDASIGMDFVYTAYNTLSDAIFANKRAEVQKQITNVLTAAAAKLLFNDWNSVGVENSGAQVIHVLNLDSVLVPSSYVLINLGKAMQVAASQMRQWFSVKVHLPTTVEYREGDWKKFKGNDVQVKEQIYEKWQDQFATAEKESYFSTTFLNNFKGLMGQLIANMKI